MTRLWSLMQDDHDAIRGVLDDLTGGSSTTEPDVGEQRRLARGLVALQSAHEITEELVIWPAVRALCPDGDSLVATALAQEHETKRALHELAHLSPGSQEFTQCVNTVAGLNRTHLSYEQNQIWPRLDDRLTARDAARLARRWEAARARTPTRPHPHLPARPAVLGTVGVAAGAVERLRDTVGRRR
ncbi:hemerythrin domain-containing protein [Streptomyces sp. NK08204]|uniref:hemerythrin domain-containing protein n=1 Tax=Streptomyces sp. NK08204 TaxID=2873260 RepID=UPI001CED1BE3|nr:hemerythrin domain-containing protein [Streptomyces sp. NK08204]